jgi:hypothetical protein
MDVAETLVFLSHPCFWHFSLLGGSLAAIEYSKNSRFRRQSFDICIFMLNFAGLSSGYEIIRG